LFGIAGFAAFLDREMSRSPMPFPPPALDLLPLIPLSARSVLDVGCGNARLLAAYRRMNPKARLLGVALDPSGAGSVPILHPDPTLAGETADDPVLSDGIDCILYNEVLQHLDDPWGLIRWQAEQLAPDGTMLICVPNSDDWRLTEQRLRGDPNQPRQGRAFGLAEIRENLRGMGLALCDVAMREPDTAAAQRFCSALTPALQALGIDPKDYASRAAASHLICRVQSHPARKMHLLGSMLAPIGGVSHVRVVHPLQAVSSDPAVSTTVTDWITPGQTPDTDTRIFILHRPSLMGESGLDRLRALTEAGYLIITEFDDHPHHFQMMRLGGELSFTGVHAVQTSTAAMAEILRAYNPEVAVFPNALVALPEVTNFVSPHPITVFFGALNREPDWRPLMPVLNRVAAQAGDRLRFQVVHDQAFFDALNTEHKTFTPTCDYDTYARILGASEISFMPLGDTAFNRAKSDLKFIEAGAARVAALASSVVYGDSIDDGRTGLLFRDPAELQVRLLRLIAMPELARALGDAARQYVTDHRMLAYQVAPRIAWYRSLWIKRDALEAARQARIQRRNAA
jgi:SAM-dependent methyltransferase